MSYIDELRSSRDNAPVAYIEFALHTKEIDNGLFLFFEGKDIPYYLPRITPICNDKYFPIKCKGKKNVIAVYDIISHHREYDKYKKAFFIDRDFNRPISTNKMIFETPCYSIENLYVSVDVFKKIIKSELQIPEISIEDNSFRILLKLYIERQKEFHKAVCLFNAWYACLIENKEQTGQEPCAPLEAKFPNGFIKTSLNGITQHYTLASIIKLFPKANEITEECLTKKINEFNNCACHLTYRGKYEIEFLLAMLKLIVADSKNEQIFTKKKITFKWGELSGEQAISVFSQYAETPESLLIYIKKITYPQLNQKSTN